MPSDWRARRLRVPSGTLLHFADLTAYATDDHTSQDRTFRLGRPPNEAQPGDPTAIGTPDNYSQGDLGYKVNTSTQVYRIVAFGKSITSGPSGDGIVLDIESF